MRNDSIVKIFIVAISVCVVCSVFVATAAVLLKPYQETNKRLDKRKNILFAAGVENIGELLDQLIASGELEPDATPDDLFQWKIEETWIDLETDREVEDEKMLKILGERDERKAAKDPDYSLPIERKKDKARIKRKAKYRKVYFTREGEPRIILPVHGKGLWSTMYGFIALDAEDFNTIKSFAFYEHGETPGLGGEVDNPRWKNSWKKNKKAFDEAWEPAIQLAKGPAQEDAEHEVDGLSGATLTANGVRNLVRFWLGDEGYGPFLTRRREGAHDG